MHQLVLASQSPRRKELLEKAGFLFSVVSVQISEIPDENLNLQEQIRDLARRKAEALVLSGKLAKGQRFLLLSSDTVVVLNQKILGKPQDSEESEKFIRQLSGQVHKVITAICLWDLDSGRVAVDHDQANVLFHNLSEKQIFDYVATGEGMDKAGAYGVQGEGRKLVAKIDGAFDTVMGLPIALVEKTLLTHHWDVERKKF